MDAITAAVIGGASLSGGGSGGIWGDAFWRNYYRRNKKCAESFAGQFVLSGYCNRSSCFSGGII